MDMNNFNNRNNFNGRGGPQIPMQMMMGSKSNSAYKFMIVLLLGILPLLLCSMFITDSSMAGEFNQWPNGTAQTAIIDIDYGFMWLIGLGVYILIFPTIVLITKFTKEVKMDVIPATASFGLAMLNMFVIPHTSAWFLILSIPSFLIIGYIIGVFVTVFISLAMINKQMTKVQNDPQFKEMMDKIQEAQNKQMNHGGQGQNKKQPKFGNNPFVDIPEENKNDEEDDSNEK